MLLGNRVFRCRSSGSAQIQLFVHIQIPHTYCRGAQCLQYLWNTRYVGQRCVSSHANQLPVVLDVSGTVTKQLLVVIHGSCEQCFGRCPSLSRNHQCQLTVGPFFVVNPAAVGSPGSTDIGYVVVRGQHVHPDPNWSDAKVQIHLNKHNGNKYHFNHINYLFI